MLTNFKQDGTFLNMNVVSSSNHNLLVPALVELFVLIIVRRDLG